MKINKPWGLLACVLVLSISQIGDPGHAANRDAGSEAIALFKRDEFSRLNEMNKASLVMLTEAGIVDKQLAKSIANAVVETIGDGESDPKLRSGDYLKVEALLLKHGGPEMTRIHSGRSRQDIGATMRRLFQRDAVLATLEGVERVRASLLALAARSPAAIVPAYTMGVQAQPISFGHYILAYSEALERDAVRLREAYARINQSPLGSAALGTSSFPINRPRLAELLGFGGVITNSLDANQISPLDAGAELSGIAASLALTLDTFANDLLSQYRYTTPWLTIEEGALTGVSSIMPQKRNPNALTSARGMAGSILGEAVSYYFKAHNTPHGSPDYKGVEPQAALIQARDFALTMSDIVGQLKFNADRALDEVNADYATTTELADILQRDANVNL